MLSWDLTGRGDIVTALTTTAEYDVAADVATVRAHGRLDLRTAPMMRAALLKAVAECPVAVIVNVTDCVAGHSAALTVFPAVARHQAGQPTVALLLSGADEDFLRDGGRAALGPVASYRTDDEARAAAAVARAHQDRLSLRTVAEPTAPAAARDLIATACRSWALEGLRENAILVISELVANAVLHAGGEIRVEAVLRQAFLHLRVYDTSPVVPIPGPRLDEPGFRDHGRGLRLIQLHCTGWGYTLNSGSDGKVVWATLRARRIGN